MNKVGELINEILKLSSKHDGSPFLVAICGAADLGKTHLATLLVNELVKMDTSACHITLDAYLMDRAQRTTLGISGYQPEAYDLSKIRSDLHAFLKGSPIEYFPYSHAEGKSLPEKITIDRCDVLFLDGLHSMHEYFRSYLSYSIFIYTNDDLLLEIRHKADIEKRKQSVEFSNRNLINELNAYKCYVEPYKNSAKVVYELREKWQYERKITSTKT